MIQSTVYPRGREVKFQIPYGDEFLKGSGIVQADKGTYLTITSTGGLLEKGTVTDVDKTSIIK